MAKDKVYFISDTHLGLYPRNESRDREIILIQWLDHIKNEAREIYLVGDIFDYWYEFKKVVPRGFVRFLGKLAELSDNGTDIHYFTGNHDVWIFDYLPGEIGLTLYRHPVVKNINGKKFYIAHGDGLGPGDNRYKLLKWAFTNKFMQWMFSRLHPNFSVGIGHAWSKNSRLSKGVYEEFLGLDKEFLVLHSRMILEKKDPGIDYFVYGHRHIPMDIKLNNTSKLLCLGDWILSFTYAELSGQELVLKRFIEKKDQPKIVKY